MKRLLAVVFLPLTVGWLGDPPDRNVPRKDSSDTLLSNHSPDYDLILRGGRIVDGTGNPWYRADLAIQGDRIAAIASRIGESASHEIQAAGLVVAPGFIDLHTHARRGIFDNPSADNYVRQGVTTI